MNDAAIATQINSGIKQCITDCARSASEASNPNLRATFAQISQDGIRRQAELAHLMQQKGWYTAPPLNPANIQRIMPQIQAIIQGGSSRPAAPNFTPGQPSYGIPTHQGSYMGSMQNQQQRPSQTFS